MHEKVVIGDATLILGDCLEILPTLGKVDAVVTSPPYGELRHYGDHIASKPMEIIPALAQSINRGGVIMWNTADQVLNGSESCESFRQALKFVDAGLRLHDTMIYCKEGVTFPDANRYHPAFEYMFIFSLGAPRHFNGLRDWRNKSAGRVMSGTDRQANGETTPVKRAGMLIDEFGLRRNWWIIANAYNGETAGHPAPMPFSMAGDHIQTWTIHGDLVLDPFMGSGTTGVACAQLGRKFIGIEIEPKYFDIACKRIEQAYAQGKLFDEKPAQAKQESFL